MCRGTTLVQVLANANIGKRPIRYGRYLDSFAADWPTRRPCLPTFQDHNGVNMFRVVVAASFLVIAAAIGLAPQAVASGPYKNCTAAHQDGRWNIPKGDPDYWPAGDRDNDGIACEG